MKNTVELETTRESARYSMVVADWLGFFDSLQEGNEYEEKEVTQCDYDIEDNADFLELEDREYVPSWEREKE